MALATFRDIGKEYAGRWVLRQVNGAIAAGQKVGLIGPNGSGKTTLLRILCGLTPPDAGTVELAGTARLGYVPQHVDFAGDETVEDYVLAEHRARTAALRAAERRVAEAAPEDYEHLLQVYQAARDAYDRYGGDHYQGRAEGMLEALGLARRAGQPVRLLSGGEKNVLAMTHALLGEPNLLVLDEPGNHLDYLGLAWLDDFLSRFNGSVLIVSHNRYLLDRVVDSVFELEDGRVNTYPGNYTAYRQQRAEKLCAQQAEYDAYQQRLAHLTALVQKFADIAQGHASDQTWGRRLRARRSQLDRLKAEAVDKPRAQGPSVSLNFDTEATRADIALQVRGYRKAFDELVLFEDVHWDVAGGQRWALVGPNGCGKSTLLKDIVKLGRWEHPVLRIGPSLTVGYAAQEQEVLDGEATVYEELLALPDATHERVLGILARFLFRDEEVHKQIRHLSGGERNRLQLARLMLLRPNFLILDEPTNHLDIPTREAVEEALREFPGTIVVVSHDRYFLDSVVDHVAEVCQRGLRQHAGNFTSFWQRYGTEFGSVTGRVSTRARDRRQSAVATEKPKAGGQAWKERKAVAAEVRKAEKRLAELEAEVERLEGAKESLEARIATAFTAGDHDAGHELSAQLATLTARLEDTYDAWVAAGEALAEMDRA